MDQVKVKIYYTPLATTTSVDCGNGSPSVTYGSSITCVATVTASGGTFTPTGPVNWTGSNGVLDSASCSLAAGAGGIATCSVAYTPSGVSGAHDLTATYVGDANFTGSSNNQSVNVNPLPVAVTADAKTKVYGAADPSLTYQFTPALVGSDTFSGSLSRLTGEHVGDYAIKQGTLALSSDYTLSYTGANLTITPLAVDVTADAKSKVYGAADPVLTYTFTPPLVSGDSFSGDLVRASGEHVGDYAITQGSLTLSSDYTLSYTGANLSITPLAVAVTADAKSKVYGAADPALTYTFTPPLVGSDTFAGSLARAAGEHVGDYGITQGTLALSSDYTLGYTGANLSITPLAVDVTANARTKIYGAADPALTYQFTPALIGPDSFSGSLSRNTGEHVGDYAITQGTLALSSDYTLSYTGANLSITPLTINVTADAKTKAVGTVDPPLTYTFDPALVIGDNFTGALARDPGELVGQYNITQGTLALSPDYTLVFKGAQFTIAGAKIYLPVIFH